MSISAGSRTSTIRTVLFTAAFLGLAAYFMLPDIFKPRPEKASWYYLHIAGGSVALSTGAFQFITSLRNRFRAYHRQAGYVYAIASFIAVGGLFALMPPKFTVFLPSQIVVASLWILAVVSAIRSIKSGHVLMHQHNMARGYLFAAYFVMVRVVDRFGMGLLKPFVDSEDARLAHSDWLSWVVPLIVLELYFGRKLTMALSASRADRKGA